MSQYLDDFLYNGFLYNKFVKDKENIKPYTHTLRNTSKLKFDNEGNLIVLKYPSHYEHKFYLKHSFGISLTFGIFWGIQNFLIYKWYKIYKSKKVFLLSAFSTVASIVEAKYLSSKVYDVKEVVLSKDNRLKVKTFNDDKTTYVMDIKDVYILSLDKFSSFFIRTNGKIDVFVMEPENGNLPNNFEIFDLVFKDKRYLKF